MFTPTTPAIPSPRAVRAIEPQLREALIGFMVRRGIPNLAVQPNEEQARKELRAQAENALGHMTVAELIGLEAQMRSESAHKPLHNHDYDPCWSD